MKLSHWCTFGILASVVAAGITSVLAQNWGEFGMCLTAFGGWMIVAKYEQAERKTNETLSR